ncbi:YeeE/YedE family protein [Kiloniella sp. EL199]|uniref:YeeE/YedE family protein n=1 Tax=Kiloniella sp. EL199 TaxID=2107581 RepID=UPI000EA31FE6|nr:YeeE/YedE thiosulfate transporter family protein [Kiloniella sp. EL199]
MDIFSLVPALAGGILIGIAVITLMLFNGRIAGISGIVGGLFPFKSNDTRWRIAFLVGLVLAPFLYRIFIGQIPEITFDASLPLLVLGGVLVGVGTQLGSGCTSGHGVCGISRLSLRSIVATLIFMATAAVTVFLIRHVLGV